LPVLVVPPFPDPFDEPPESDPFDEPPFPDPFDEPPAELDDPPVDVSEFDELSPPQPLTRPTSASVPTRAWRREVAIFGASK
jgi:hypothetical protein